MTAPQMTAKRAAGIGLILLALAGVPALATLTAHKSSPTVYAVSVNVPDGTFSVANLKPGDYIVRCARVRNEGSTVARLTGTLRVTGSLARYMVVRVDTGTGLGDAGPSCTGFVPDGGHAFGSGSGVVASALTPQVTNAWPAHAARSYRVILVMSPYSGGEAQRLTAQVSMVWQAGAPLVPKPKLPRFRVNSRTGVITFRFAFPAAGALTTTTTMARSKPYGRAHTNSTKPTTKTIRMKPTAAALKALRRARAAHKAFKVTITLVYGPSGATPVRLGKSITFRRAGRRR
jgi:hypothetical protein